MSFTARGLKAWIIVLFILLGIIFILILLFHLLVFLLPVIIVLAIIGYFFRMLNKVKKDKKKDFVDVKFKVKR